MRILGIIPDYKEDLSSTAITSSCSLYRTTGPFTALQKAGHVAMWLPIKTAFEELSKPGFASQWDIIQFHRVVKVPGLEDWIRDTPWLLRGQGPAVVVDYDDDLSNKYRCVGPGEIDIGSFSACTVSVPMLKQVMLKYHKKVHVIRNAVVPEFFNPEEPLPRIYPNLTIGLTGSKTHEHDWQVVVEPLLDILRSYPDVRLLCAGYVPSSFIGHDQLLTVSTFEPGYPTTYFPLEIYPFLLRQCDIVLAPVNPLDKFNWSKSNIKSIEAQATARKLGNGQIGGAAIIATGDIPNYRDCIEEGKTGFLVPHFHEKDWRDKVEILLKSSELRERMQVEGYRRCMQHFTVYSCLAERVEAYMRIIKDERAAASKVLAKVAALA